MSSDRFLVTGAMGCIGAWVVRHLVDEETPVTTFDMSSDDRRLRQLIKPGGMSRVEHVKGDITKHEEVASATEGKTHVVHLAALQVPLCRANPIQGAAVNVLGTVNVFETVKKARIEHLSFASSAAVYGHPSHYSQAILPPEAPRLPETLYGVYKVANEDTAKVYWAEDGVPSVGIRPYTVYGPGRDVGVTAEPTLAVEAAVRGEPHHIPYGGTAGFMYASDVARVLIDAARAEPKGGETYSMRGDIVSVAEFVEIAHEATGTSSITHGDDPLPFPDGTEDGPLRDRLGTVAHTPLREAIEATAEFFMRGVAN